MKNNNLESAIAVRVARRQAGYTQKELAKLANVPQSTIARIEKGDNTSVETLRKIATALDKELEIRIEKGKKDVHTEDKA